MIKDSHFHTLSFLIHPKNASDYGRDRDRDRDYDCDRDRDYGRDCDRDFVHEPRSEAWTTFYVEEL
jgi:hypothetical protein